MRFQQAGKRELWEEGRDGERGGQKGLPELRLSSWLDIPAPGTSRATCRHQEAGSVLSRSALECTGLSELQGHKMAHSLTGGR